MIVLGCGQVYERRMRNLIITVAVLAACGGPSGRDVAMAKQARYSGDKLQLFADMKAGVEANYKLDVSDETKLALRTIGRWYTPDGLVTTATLESGKLPDKSLNIALVAQLLPEQDKWIVHVEPVILRYNAGISKLEPMRREDPSLPGYVNGKSDELAFDINKKLKPYEVKGVPAVVPPSTPSPTPDEPKPAPEGGAGSGSAQ